MKQKTLEKDLTFPLIIENGMDYLNLTTKIFNNGAKWQQERMYSEEDMKKCWDACKRFKRPISEGYAPNFNEFIEQFKK